MFLSTIAPGLIDGWNERVLTEADARSFCKAHQVYIVDDTKTPYGKFLPYRGYLFILLNPDLSYPMKLWVLWHEIGHFILHDPKAAKFSKLIRSKAEREANYIAAVALMPKSVIIGKTFFDIQREFEYPMDVIQIRDRISRDENL